AVYTPRLWRRYRELLLRYEHLVRADEKSAAAKLGQVLRSTAQELEDALALRRDSASAGNVLPLSAAFGFADVTAWADQERKFRPVWTNRTRTVDRDTLLRE